MVREIDESGADDILASGWSPMLGIRVYLPENILPVASAKAGIFVNGVGLFNDLVDYAKTGDEVTYSGAESYDPDGEIVAYNWEIFNSQGTSINLLGDKDERTFVRTYNEPGTYFAILTVTDDRGGSSTWQVEVTVTKSGGYGNVLEEEGGGYSTTMLIGIAGAAIGVLAALGFGLRRMSGAVEDNWGESWEDTATPGPLELNCPTCNGLISITTTQRPIQVGCPMCQSQFVIRE